MYTGARVSSVQRIRRGGPYSVIRNSCLVLSPISFAVLAYVVPTPAPASSGDVRSMLVSRGLNLMSFSPSARNAKTSSTGRSITIVPVRRRMMSLSSRGPGSRAQLAQAGDARDQEVLARAHRHEPRLSDQEPRRIALDRHLRRRAVVGQQDPVLVLAETEDVAVGAPLRLDDLELPPDRAAERDEDEPALLAVVGLPVWCRRPVGHAAADHAVSAAARRVPAQRVPRVDAADVGAQRAPRAVRVPLVAKVVDALGRVVTLAVAAVRCEYQRRAVAPAADDPRGELLLPARERPRPLPERTPEGRHVLVQLAVHHVGPVPAQRPAWRHRELLVLVVVAEYELAQRELLPAAVALRLAVARLGDVAVAGHARLREAVGEAEVLAIAGRDRGALDVHDGDRRPVQLAGQLGDERVERRLLLRVDGYEDARVARAEALLPVLGMVLF